jgi:hypothetical protein
MAHVHIEIVKKGKIPEQVLSTKLAPSLKMFIHAGHISWGVQRV